MKPTVSQLPGEEESGYGRGMMTVFAYWSRWVTARRLTWMRVVDPQWVENHERIAAIGGFNLQLDEVS